MQRYMLEMETKIKELQVEIEYQFNNTDVLVRALTHSSFANEHKKHDIKYNERLEFLGDSVLSIVVSDYIFTKYSNYPEGELTRLRATVVCEPILAILARKINLGKYLLLGKGEKMTGGRQRTSILADAFEALIAAVYIDGGMTNAKKFILDNISESIEKAVNGKLFLDHKTHLQEVLQKSSRDRIEYKVIKEEGPDHNKMFYMQVKVNDEILGEGKGKSKKESEQNAAKEALMRIGADYE